MPTLLQINSVYSIGSTGRTVQNIGRFVMRQGWEKFSIYGRHIAPTYLINVYKASNLLDVNFHVLQTRLFDRHGLASGCTTKKVIEIIKAVAPDIIHIHNLHGYYINIKILFEFLKKADIPVVWTFHDCWPMTGHCSYFDFVGCEKWKTECNKCPQKNEYPASILLDRSKKNFCLKKDLFTSVKDLTIVPVSNWLGNIVKQSFFAEFPIQVIHNGIDTETFRPGPHSSIRIKYNLKDKFIILGVAHIWSKRKGYDDFIRLSQKLNSDFQIILVGLNKNKIKKLPSNILGIEKTDNVKELVELYSYADVFINPSVEETFGMTTVEALSCGTPVVVYNTTASPEIVTSETGFVVEKKNIDGLLYSINTIKEKGKNYYSVNCRMHAEKMFNLRDCLLNYFNLYGSILKRKND